MNNLILKLFLYGLSSVKPSKLMREAITVNTKGQVIVNNSNILFTDKKFHVIGFGKAALEMGLEVEKILNRQLVSGILSIPFETSTERVATRLKIFKGAQNNLPDEKALFATDEILKYSLEIPKSDVLIVLVSGGGSSLFCKPVSGVTLNEKLITIKELVKKGADIEELNTVRKQLSAVKGGKFLNFLSHLNDVYCFILSDVIGDKLEVIASGPTVKSSQNRALEILLKYDLLKNIPETVIKALGNSQFKNLPDLFVHHKIVGSNQVALNAIRDEASKIGLGVKIVSSKIQGVVSEVGKNYADFSQNVLCYLKTREKKYLDSLGFELKNFEANFCFLFGGETTVIVKGLGKGGRNQELALWFSVYLNEVKQQNPEIFRDFDVIFLSAGTDGIDGPTDVAGCIGSHSLISDSRRLGLDVYSFLNNNDSYNFISNVDLEKYFVKTGHTGTNVMDIHILLFFKKI